MPGPIYNFLDAFSGRAEDRQKQQAKTLEAIREQQRMTLDQARFGLDVQRYQDEQKNKQQDAIIRDAITNPSKAAAQWNSQWGTDIVPESGGFRDRKTGNFFTIKDGKPVQSDIGQERAGNFLASIRGSGGIKPDQDLNVMQAFARGAAQPEIRAAAQENVKQSLKDQATQALTTMRLARANKVTKPKPTDEEAAAARSFIEKGARGEQPTAFEREAYDKRFGGSNPGMRLATQLWQKAYQSWLSPMGAMGEGTPPSVESFIPQAEKLLKLQAATATPSSAATTFDPSQGSAAWRAANQPSSAPTAAQPTVVTAHQLSPEAQQAIATITGSNLPDAEKQRRITEVQRRDAGP